jgi:NTE family protein
MANRRSVDLALQGGGSHGAFTWGVLDALLEDGRLSFDGVSGTSAGAMNAAVLAVGLARGGPEEARRSLAAFWAEIGGTPACFARVGTPGSASPAWPAFLFNTELWGPGAAWWDAWTRLFSPFQFNPLNLNPLRDILERHVDVDLLRQGPLKLFVTATAVKTGQARVFTGDDLSVDALLASACLPQLFQAVQIEGEAYWDGGYSGNPALWPLVYGTESDDVMLVQINPLERDRLPLTAMEIADRLNEITFNASLVGELRAIAFVQRLLREQRVDRSRYKEMRLHRIADEAGLSAYGASSKLNSDPRLLQSLFGLGRRAGQDWLAAHFEAIGHHGTVEIGDTFLSKRQARNKVGGEGAAKALDEAEQKVRSAAAAKISAASSRRAASATAASPRRSAPRR